MNDDSAKPLDLGMDLTLSFQPAWAKESDSSAHAARIAQLAQAHDKRETSGSFRDKPRNRDGAPFNSHRKNDRRPDNHDRKPGGNSPTGQNNKPNDDRRPSRDRNDRNNDRRRDNRDRRNDPANKPRPEPQLIGWIPRFLPEKSGIDGLARQIKSTLKAYPLFDLAKLVLEKPERYTVELSPQENAAPLWQVTTDSSLWPSQEEAASHALRSQLDSFYKRISVTIDPPKGNFPCVAQCGFSGELIGPPNHHDYQANLRKLHSSRFKQMSFEAFTNNIRMVKDEELVAKWKELQCTREEFVPLDATEENPVHLPTLSDAERHFRTHYLPGCVTQVTSKCRIHGPAIAQLSAHIVRALVREEWEKLSRFPLPLAHTLGDGLSSHGLQIFKAHENVTYVGIARPRYLDRTTNPVSANLSELLNFLETNEKTPRHEQWKGLLELRGAPTDDSDPARLKETETSVATDLTWLLHEGFVVDFAGKGLELPHPYKKTSSRRDEKKNKQQPQAKSSKNSEKNPPEPTESHTPNTLEPLTPLDPSAISQESQESVSPIAEMTENTVLPEATPPAESAVASELSNEIPPSQSQQPQDTAQIETLETSSPQEESSPRLPVTDSEPNPEIETENSQIPLNSASENPNNLPPTKTE